MPTIDVDRDTARAAAQRELDKPIYPKGSVAQRIHEWIHELLYRIVEKGSSVPGGWLTIIVLVALLVAAIVVAVRIARTNDPQPLRRRLPALRRWTAHRSPASWHRGTLCSGGELERGGSPSLARGGPRPGGKRHP